MSGTTNYLPLLIISLEMVRTQIIHLHAHPQVDYRNCVVLSVSVYPLKCGCANETFGKTDK